MRVLFCRRNRHPEEREIKNCITDFAELLGGEFAEGQLADGVVIIHNPSIHNQLINRIITKDTKPVGYIKGDFFICGRRPERYRSLTDYEIEKIDPCIQLSEIELYDLRSALRGDE